MKISGEDLEEIEFAVKVHRIPTRPTEREEIASETNNREGVFL